MASMKLLIQRVSRGAVRIGGTTVGQIGQGFVVFIGIRAEDTLEDARHLAQRTASLRIFTDADQRMNQSLQDIGGGALVISQFTLYADTRKGNRPSFIRAGPPELAASLYAAYIAALREILGVDRVATGHFGADMEVEIINDGPVTIAITTDDP